MRASGAIFCGRAFAGKAAGKNGRGDFSREYRRRLYWDRMAIRHAGSEKTSGISEQRNVEGRQETNSLGFRREHQADFTFWHQAIGAQGDSICFGEQATERDAGTQGKYSEIYGRRVSRLGI